MSEIKVNITSRATHRGLERSTTLNRRYVKRPTKLLVTDGTEEVEAKVAAPAEAPAKAPRVEYHKTRKIAITSDADIEAEKKSAKISHMAPMAAEPAPAKAPAVVEEDLPPAPNPYQAAINARKAEKTKKAAAAVSSRALKDAAIAKALAEMESNAEIYEPKKSAIREEKIAEKVMLSEMKANKKDAKKAKKKAEKETRHFKKHKTGRIILAFATSAACMIALAAIVKINLPNVSVKVAAVQTGVEASYPSYVPRDFSLTGVYTDDKNSVIIEFNGPEGKRFTLSEDKSSWDSNALLTNYVKGAYGTNYDVIREQGITVYISSSNAAWVNKGIFYRITAASGTLSKKQIKNIVGSL